MSINRSDLEESEPSSHKYQRGDVVWMSNTIGEVADEALGIIAYLPGEVLPADVMSRRSSDFTLEDSVTEEPLYAAYRPGNHDGGKRPFWIAREESIELITRP